MKYHFYKCEFSVENDAFLQEGGFEYYQEAVRLSMELFNHRFSETRAAGVMPWHNFSGRLFFIMKISPEVEDKSSMLNRYKDMLYEEISGCVQTDKQSVLKSQDSIHTRLFKQVDSLDVDALRAVSTNEEDHIDRLMADLDIQLAEEDDLPFDDDELPDDKLPENELSDDELPDDELTGVFDFDIGYDEEEDEEDSEQQEDETEGEEKIIEVPGPLKEFPSLDQFRLELQSISRFGDLNNKLQRESKMKKVFPFHYVFTIDSGMGLSKVLHDLAYKLYQYDIISAPKVLEYNGSLSISNRDSSDNLPGIFTRKDNGQVYLDDLNIVAVNISKNMSDPFFSFDRFMDILWEARGRVVCVLVIEGGLNESNLKLLKRIKSSLNVHHVHFPGYSNEEFVKIAQLLLKKDGFELDSEAEELLLGHIEKQREEGSFQNLRSLQKILEAIRFEKMFQSPPKPGKNVKTLGVRDFNAIMQKDEAETDDPWKELEGLVGLEQIKKVITEIISNAKVRVKKHEIGIEKEAPCYHMMFSGNPGTGKTMVARILGRLFKHVGVLSRGQLVEVTRENMVGRYIGHTAPMVIDCINRAMGSVLFIDEAYSLYTNSDDRRDFGHEVVETLIKEMENKRGEFIVIMAGYTEEMKKLLAMNPGLEERIPYRIEFPDYTVDELMEIFILNLGSEYILCDGVADIIRNIFITSLKVADNRFGNGRLARNLAERLKMKQALRLCKENDFDREDLLTIRLEDAQALQSDETLQRQLKGDKPGAIGFHLA